MDSYEKQYNHRDCHSLYNKIWDSGIFYVNFLINIRKNISIMLEAIIKEFPFTFLQSIITVCSNNRTCYWQLILWWIQQKNKLYTFTNICFAWKFAVFSNYALKSAKLTQNACLICSLKFFSNQSCTCEMSHWGPNCALAGTIHMYCIGETFKWAWRKLHYFGSVDVTNHK